MAGESQARIDAALRLAEETDRHVKRWVVDSSVARAESDYRESWRLVDEALSAYRATLPKLRSRAEVDAEIAAVMRMAHGAGWMHAVSGAVNMTSRIESLCAEPTAPEADD